MAPTSDSSRGSLGPAGLRRLGHAGPLLEVEAVEWKDGAASTTQGSIVEETPVVLVYNHVPHVVMMATPEDLEDFALGFSVTEELVASADELLAVTVERLSRGIEVKISISDARAKEIESRARRLSGRTGCGICGANDLEGVLKTLHAVAPGQPVVPDIIHRAMEALTAHQQLNRESGAVHAAGWATLDGDIAFAREDVGRHNALDKLVGAALKQKVRAGEGFVVVTSRASFEMVQKASVLGAPILAAISGPTALAVRVARESGVTLVGFARKDRLTVYTHPHRVVSPGPHPPTGAPARGSARTSSRSDP
jgi:FdhD protein